MVPVIPQKRRDGKSSFGDLVSYVVVRDEDKADARFQVIRAKELTGEATKNNQFVRLTDYVTKEQQGDVTQLIRGFADGSEQVNFHGVTCFHNCQSVATAADEMQQVADKGKGKRATNDPVFHYILSWPEHECPNPEQIQDCVHHSLMRLGLSGHQYLAAVHTDTDNLHVHIAVNRVHPETLRFNRLSYSKEKLHKACRELEIKHGFMPVNGCFVQAENKQIVRRSAWEKQQLSAWCRPHKQTLGEYVADTALAGLAAAPVNSWDALHLRMAREGLYLAEKDGELMVQDGWVRERSGVPLAGFGTAWKMDTLAQQMGPYQSVPKDIFKRAGEVKQYNPETLVKPQTPFRVREKYPFVDYVREHIRADFEKLDGHIQQHTARDVHALFARQGLILQQRGQDFVVLDAYDKTRTPVRAESIHPSLNAHFLKRLNGGWSAVPQDIFKQVPPQWQYQPQGMVKENLTENERDLLFFGRGPNGAVRRELFSDKESLHGYAVAKCRQDIDRLIRDGEFTWQKCHEVFAQSGLLLVPQYKGLVVKDAYNKDATPVRASAVHPDLALSRAEPQAGPFEPVPMDIFTRFPPRSQYQPDVSARDKQVRMEQRMARAEARAELRERYDVFRAQWQRPELNARERYAHIALEARVKKLQVRETEKDPITRLLKYHIIELHRTQAQIHLKEALKAERQQLATEGKLHPPGWRQWVEQEALKGDKAALSALRGMAYREKRGKREPVTTEQVAVIKFDAGSAPTNISQPGLKNEILKDGSVVYRREDNNQLVSRDTGERFILARDRDSGLVLNNAKANAKAIFRRDSERFEPDGEDKKVNGGLAILTAMHNRRWPERRRHITRADVEDLSLKAEKIQNERSITLKAQQASVAQQEQEKRRREAANRNDDLEDETYRPSGPTLSR